MLDNLIATLAVPPVPSLKTKVKAEIENNTVECRDYTEPDIKNPLTVICYTPAGNPIMVPARDEAHKAYLLRTNPAPKDTK
jgi:hypothetical protein